jgi:hypothetical protein
VLQAPESARLQFYSEQLVVFRNGKKYLFCYSLNKRAFKHIRSGRNSQSADRLDLLDQPNRFLQSLEIDLRRRLGVFHLGFQNEIRLIFGISLH